MTRRYALSDSQRERLKDLLPGRAGQVGRPAQDNRLFVQAVPYRYRAGIAWRDLPARFGDYFRVVHLRHSRWSRAGVWQRVFDVLAVNADNEWGTIDAAIVRAHQHSAGAKEPGLPGHWAQRWGLSVKIAPRSTPPAMHLATPPGFTSPLGRPMISRVPMCSCPKARLARSLPARPTMRMSG
jgi:transposase